MKIGDLVKIYNFTQRARDKFRRDGMKNADAYFIALIADDRSNHFCRQVLRSDGEVDFYNLDRMELISESLEVNNVKKM